MALEQFFELAKLTLTAFSDEKRSVITLGRSVKVQYNPETLSYKYETVFQDRQGIFTSSKQARFSRTKPRELSVTLVFDGTHVSYMGLEQLGNLDTVAKRVADFLAVCYDVVGELHAPAYLQLTWGQGVLGSSFDCRAQTTNIRYTLFNRDGSPLRAELDVVFLEDIDPEKIAKRNRFSSPDLTHRRTVRAGDTLPILCRDIYGSTAHYLRVAEINGLDDFRHLEPGRELIFPPFAKNLPNN